MATAAERTGELIRHLPLPHQLTESIVHHLRAATITALALGAGGAAIVYASLAGDGRPAVVVPDAPKPNVPTEPVNSPNIDRPVVVFDVPAKAEPTSTPMAPQPKPTPEIIVTNCEVVPEQYCDSVDVLKRKGFEEEGFILGFRLPIGTELRSPWAGKIRKLKENPAFAGAYAQIKSDADPGLIAEFYGSMGFNNFIEASVDPSKPFATIQEGTRNLEEDLLVVITRLNPATKNAEMDLIQVEKLFPGVSKKNFQTYTLDGGPKIIVLPTFKN